MWRIEGRKNEKENIFFFFHHFLINKLIFGPKIFSSALNATATSRFCPKFCLIFTFSKKLFNCKSRLTVFPYRHSFQRLVSVSTKSIFEPKNFSSASKALAISRFCPKFCLIFTYFQKILYRKSRLTVSPYRHNFQRFLSVSQFSKIHST